MLSPRSLVSADWPIAWTSKCANDGDAAPFMLKRLSGGTICWLFNSLCIVAVAFAAAQFELAARGAPNGSISSHAVRSAISISISLYFCFVFVFFVRATLFFADFLCIYYIYWRFAATLVCWSVIWFGNLEKIKMRHSEGKKREKARKICTNLIEKERSEN